MTGERAFESARNDAAMAKSTTLADARDQVATRQVIAAPRGSRTEQAATRSASGRIFAKRDGIWTDASHHDSLKVTTIAPFSPAWFALAKARPALAEALGLDAPVILAGRRVSVKVAEGGLITWSAGALDRFLTEFDGR